MKVIKSDFKNMFNMKLFRARLKKYDNVRDPLTPLPSPPSPPLRTTVIEENVATLRTDDSSIWNGVPDVSLFTILDVVCTKL